MHRRNISLWAVLLLLASSAVAAEPNLKAGVRLSLATSRLQAWAAPDVVDWNNDGLNDVVVGHLSGALFVYLNRGFDTDGLRFEPTALNRQDEFGRGGMNVWAWRFNKASCACPGPGRISPRVVDWDQDGKKDFVIGDGRGAQVRVWRNVGTDVQPAFSIRHLEYLPDNGGIRPYHETVQPCIADFNGDGKKDLLMGRNRGLYVYLNEGTNNAPEFAFERRRLGDKIRNVFPAERLSPAVFDWDQDGKQDLIVGSQQGEVWFARNVGTKTRPQFSGYVGIQAGGKDIQVGSEARIAVADLDGDGQKDLVVGAGGGTVWFYQARHSGLVARGRHVRVQRGSSVAVELVGTDDQKRPLTFEVLKAPEHGTLSGAAPKLAYTPNKDYAGQDRFTFRVGSGDLKSAPATVTIEVQRAAKPPKITTQPVDAIVGVGQPARFQVVASGTPPLAYQWKRNGEIIPRATGPSYFVRPTKQDENAKFTVTVKNAAGSAVSRNAALQVKPFPSDSDDVPVIGIQLTNDAAEPATPGLLTLTRSGNTESAVTVKLTFRSGHEPAVPHLHFVAPPSSVTLKAGQTTAQIPIVPIDDTLGTGPLLVSLQIQPDPAYRVSKQAAARMRVLDDDCPHVGIRAVKRAGKPAGNTPARSAPSFEVTAHPPPRRDTKVVYDVGGTAVAGLDYERLPGTVTIRAGESTARIDVKPYRQAEPNQNRTVAVTLPLQEHTYFDFYRYLTLGRSASVALANSDAGPPPPAPGQTAVSDSAQAEVEKLRKEVSQLGWIVFTARTQGPGSDLDLFRMRPDGSQLRNITNTPQYDEYSARVSRDGKRLLYRRVAKGAKVPPSRLTGSVGQAATRTWPPTATLVIANGDGSAAKPAGGDGDYAWATWGPDGKQIACLEKVAAAETSAGKPAKPPGKNAAAYQIVIRSADTLDKVRAFPSKGIVRQAVWSPDGKRILGQAEIPPGKSRLAKGVEYPLGVGKMASLDVETGKLTALSRFPDWYPVWADDSNGDWFAGGSPAVLHSANNYGICPAYYAMLYHSGLQGRPSALVFGEYRKHVWGGSTSPDEKYAVFVISGESWPLAGKLAIIRLADAPIARGRSRLFHEVLADHFPDLNQGPVLDLSQVLEAFEPQWVAETAVEAGPRQ